MPLEPLQGPLRALEPLQVLGPLPGPLRALQGLQEPEAVPLVPE